MERYGATQQPAPEHQHHQNQRHHQQQQITLEAVRDGVREVVLDTRDLEVTRCELLISSPEAPDDEKSKAPPAPQLSFALGARHKALGAPLTIALPAPLAAGARVMVGVRFATSPESTALQFLDPAQTAGGKRPYLFSQCQAIHARSMVPCQDSPAVKAPYTAAVRAPADLTALMSAVPADDGDEEGTRLPGVDADGAAASASTSSEAKRVHRFKQAVPVPSYLIALAVGDLASRELSPRTRVWSEPSVVEAAAYEFADTAAYLEAGEALAGPYAWGRYDLLLLPPSFPYGGMENPCLTFVTPTLLAGDRRLAGPLSPLSLFDERLPRRKGGLLCAPALPLHSCGKSSQTHTSFAPPCHPPNQQAQPDQRRRARDRALVVRQPRDQRVVAGLLLERGVDRLPGAAHPRAPARRRRDALCRGARRGAARRGGRAHRARPQLHAARPRPVGGRGPRRRVLARAVREGCACLCGGLRGWGR